MTLKNWIMVFLLVTLLINSVSAFENPDNINLTADNITERSARLSWNETITNATELYLNGELIDTNNLNYYYQLSELKSNSYYSFILKNESLTEYELTFKTDDTITDKLLKILYHYIILIIALILMLCSLPVRAWLLSGMGLILSLIGFFLHGTTGLYFGHWDIILYGLGVVFIAVITTLEIGGK